MKIGEHDEHWQRKNTMIFQVNLLSFCNLVYETGHYTGRGLRFMFDLQNAKYNLNAEPLLH